MRIRFMLLKVEHIYVLSKYKNIGRLLEKFFKNIGKELVTAQIPLNAVDYLTLSFFSALLYGGILFFIILLVNLLKPEFGFQAVFQAFSLGLLFFMIFLFLHTFYPKIMSGKVASEVDENLTVALKSMLIQVSSGVTLFDSMKNIASANYGKISKEFASVVQRISSGGNELQALELLAAETKSEYLNKTVWQMITSLRSGSSLNNSLSAIVNSLSEMQSRAIKAYAGELNMMILMYMLVAAAIPTIGITFLVILSAIGGSSVEESTIVTAVGAAFVLQVVLIGLVKNRVPKVYS